MLIVAFDTVAMFASAAALVVTVARWRAWLAPDIRALIVLLLIVQLAHVLMLWSEWAGLTDQLEDYEDFTGALLPMLWAFVFYAWIQHGLQERRRRSEEDLRITLESIGDAVISTDHVGRVTRLNPTAEQLTGWSRDAAVGRPLDEVFPIVSALDGSKVEDPVARVLATGEIVGLANHTQLLARDGSRPHIADSAAPIRDPHGRTIGVVLVFRDVSEDYRLRAELLDKQHRLDLAIDGSDLGMWHWDVARDSLVIDARSAAMLGEPPGPLTTTFAQWQLRIHPEDQPISHTALQAHLDGRTPRYEAEHRVRAADGSWCWVLERGKASERDEAGRPVRVCGTHVDLTQHKRIEENMRSRARVEAVGRLAGGVAHDLNNLLTPIMGYADMLMGNASLAQDARTSLGEVMRAATSARNLVRQLLSFSRQQRLRMEPIDLNTTILEFSNLLRRTIPANVRIRSDLADGLPPILADRGQVEQILMNLAVNAADAMPDGGEFAISTHSSDETTDDGTARCVLLRIRDTGRGMEESVRERAFDPFFSTKGERGSGLGLATVHGIVTQHRGRIRLDSAVARGTTFEILLPQAPAASLAQSREEKGPAPRGRGETVLLVEDNGMVRRLAQLALEDQGYNVIAREDGSSALDLLERSETRVDLLLSDVVMPGIGARQLLDRALRLRPKLRTLLMSGYDDGVMPPHVSMPESRRLLQKPFSTRELAQHVRAALDEP